MKDLRDADILQRTPEGYALTPRGRELLAIVVPLDQWSTTWSAEIFQYISPAMEAKVAARKAAKPQTPEAAQ